MYTLQLQHALPPAMQPGRGGGGGWQHARSMLACFKHERPLCLFVQKN